MKSYQFDTLVRDCKPTALNINRATDTFWSGNIHALVTGSFFCGLNEKGIGFVATFKIESNKVRCTLTPTEDKGHIKHKHLSRWWWMPLEAKLRTERNQHDVEHMPDVSATVVLP